MLFPPSLNLDISASMPSMNSSAAQRQQQYVKATIEKTKLVLLSVVTNDDELLDDSDDEYSVYDYENQPSDDLSSGRVITGTA